MSDFYEEQISDLEDHVGSLEIDLKEANQEIKKLRDAFDLFINKTSDFMIRRGINPCEWASYRDAVKALEATK